MADTFVAHTPDNEISGPPLFSVGLNVGEPNESIVLVITGGVGLLCALLPVSYTHLRAHETVLDLVCRLLLEKKVGL